MFYSPAIKPFHTGRKEQYAYQEDIGIQVIGLLWIIEILNVRQEARWATNISSHVFDLIARGKHDDSGASAKRNLLGEFSRYATCTVSTVSTMSTVEWSRQNFVR